MFPSVNPTTLPAWEKLQTHFNENKNRKIKDLFGQDANRFASFHLVHNDVLFDFSKNNVSKETLDRLVSLAEECKLREAVNAMFGGEKINKTEGRAVLHTALRNFGNGEVLMDGVDVMPEVKKVQEQMKTFAAKIHSGEWTGFSGKK